MLPFTLSGHSPAAGAPTAEPTGKQGGFAKGRLLTVNQKDIQAVSRSAGREGWGEHSTPSCPALGAQPDQLGQGGIKCLRCQPARLAFPSLYSSPEG